MEPRRSDQSFLKHTLRFGPQCRLSRRPWALKPLNAHSIHAQYTLNAHSIHRRLFERQTQGLFEITTHPQYKTHSMHTQDTHNTHSMRTQDALNAHSIRTQLERQTQGLFEMTIHPHVYLTLAVLPEDGHFLWASQGSSVSTHRKFSAAFVAHNDERHDGFGNTLC